MVMIIYFTIGVIIFACTSISMLVRKAETVESMFLEPAYWIATIICVIIWPVIVGWGIYDLIQLVKQSKEEGL